MDPLDRLGDVVRAAAFDFRDRVRARFGERVRFEKTGRIAAGHAQWLADAETLRNEGLYGAAARPANRVTPDEAPRRRADAEAFVAEVAAFLGPVREEEK